MNAHILTRHIHETESLAYLALTPNSIIYSNTELVELIPLFFLKKSSQITFATQIMRIYIYIYSTVNFYLQTV